MRLHDEWVDDPMSLDLADRLAFADAAMDEAISLLEDLITHEVVADPNDTKEAAAARHYGAEARATLKRLVAVRDA